MTARRVRAQRSADGVTWQNTGNATNLNGLTNPKIGVYATASTAGGAQPKVASFDWFKLDAPQEPSDEFDGTSLNLCRWTSIVRHQPTGYTVADGKLTLPAAHGDFFANAPNNNPNIILQPAPSGSWTAETRMTFLPNENYEQAGLLVYGDDANYVKADLVHANGRGVEFLREVNNVAAGFGGFVGLPAQRARDGRPADHLRRDDAARVLAAPGRRLEAVRRARRAVGRAEPEDRHLRQRQQRDGHDARRRGVRLLPPHGGAAGHHGADDDAHAGAGGAGRPERLVPDRRDAHARDRERGHDAVQDRRRRVRAYTGPVTLSGPGTTTVTYRSTDAEGNVEADKTVTVKVDKVAPTSTATLDPAQPGAGGTYSGPVNVTLAGADAAGGSGLDKLEYRLDGGEWTVYSAPVTVSADRAAHARASGHRPGRQPGPARHGDVHHRAGRPVGQHAG